MSPDRKSLRKMTVAIDAQAQILAAVDELFYQEGARAVGVDAVVKRAGVNKMSLYRQFASKDALLMEYLKRRDERYWSNFEVSLAKHADQPAKQLLQIFIDFSERASVTGYRGCPFVNIAVEFPDARHPARQMVADNKKRLLGRLQALAKEVSANDSAMLASSLALLFEGACAASQTYTAEDGLITSLPKVASNLINLYAS